MGRIFVYGTLMRGECRHWLVEKAVIRRIRAATIGGRLFDFGGYPGLRLESNGNNFVYGELIECDRLESVLPELDEEEGPDFRRELVTVKVEGATEPAYVYVLASDPEGATVISSGDWKLRGRERRL